MAFKQVTAQQLKEMPPETPVMLEVFNSNGRKQINCTIGQTGSGRKFLITCDDRKVLTIRDTLGEFFVYEGRK